MDKKNGIYVRLQNDTIDKIKTLSKTSGESQSAIVTKAIEQYDKNSSDQYQLFTDIFTKLIEQQTKELKQNIKRLQVTGNVIDRDTQIILEFMNHYYLANDFKTLGSTDKYKTEGLLEAEKLINDRIQKQRQKKLDAEKQKV